MIQKELKILCRKLRKEQTYHEQTLWNVLRNRAFGGLKFFRQYPIGRYIVDFYCHEKRLAIEIDGKIHTKQSNKEYDTIRQEELESTNLKVLRFSNDEIEHDLKGVLNKILNSI